MGLGGSGLGRFRARWGVEILQEIEPQPPKTNTEAVDSIDHRLTRTLLLYRHLSKLPGISTQLELFQSSSSLGRPTVAKAHVMLAMHMESSSSWVWALSASAEQSQCFSVTRKETLPGIPNMWIMGGVLEVMAFPGTFPTKGSRVLVAVFSA